MASASGYNHQRFARTVLKKARKWEASLTVQLYPSHWRFAESPHNFPYEGPMRPFLLALRSQVIPSALIPFLYDINPPVAFVDGCLVVEIQDFRRVPECRSRVVMRPAAESLAQTIDHMLERRGEVWEEELSLELESRIIAATSPPLYLGTSLLATRNAVLSMALTSPATPGLSAEGHLRCPQAATEATTSSDRMRRILQAGGGSGTGASFHPNWSILRLKERMANAERIKEAEKEARAAGMWNGGASGTGGIGGIGDMQGQSVGQLQGGGGGDVGEAAQAAAAAASAPKKKKKKRAADDDSTTVTTAVTTAPPAKKKKGKVNEEPTGVKAKEEPAEVKPKKKSKKKVVKADG